MADPTDVEPPQLDDTEPADLSTVLDELANLDCEA